jgi:hypothetical protein
MYIIFDDEQDIIIWGDMGAIVVEEWGVYFSRRGCAQWRLSVVEM